MKLKQEAFAVAKASWRGLFFVKQIAPDQLLQKLITIQLTNHSTGIVVVGDIGGIFRKQVADDLIDGVIAFFIQGVEYIPENLAHILLIIAGNSEFDCIIRHEIDLQKVIFTIITQKDVRVKPCDINFEN